MYRITVEEEKNGVYTKMEDACLEATGYALMAERGGGNKVSYHIQNLSRGDIMNLLLNSPELMEIITMALPVLPMAIKAAMEGNGELPPEIDAEELFKNPFPKNSGGGKRKGLFARLRRSKDG